MAESSNSPQAEAARSPRARREQLRTRYDAVRAQIDSARTSAGRQDEVRLVVVTKFHPFADQVHLAQIGARDLGENRVQEAQDKAKSWEHLASAGAELAEDGRNAAHSGMIEGEAYPQRPRLHMIGHIQSKKTGAVARWADEVESVDSIKVAEGLSRGRVREIESQDADPLRCLVQLSLDGDTSRGGVGANDFFAVCEQVAELPGLELGGMMVVPPLDGDSERHFAEAARFVDDLRANFPQATEFSAGMSGDLDAAISAGSTCVRVGTAILGPRPIL